MLEIEIAAVMCSLVLHECFWTSFPIQQAPCRASCSTWSKCLSQFSGVSAFLQLFFTAVFEVCVEPSTNQTVFPLYAQHLRMLAIASRSRGVGAVIWPS